MLSDSRHGLGRKLTKLTLGLCCQRCSTWANTPLDDTNGIIACSSGATRHESSSPCLKWTYLFGKPPMDMGMTVITSIFLDSGNPNHLRREPSISLASWCWERNESSPVSFESLTNGFKKNDKQPNSKRRSGKNKRALSSIKKHTSKSWSDLLATGFGLKGLISRSRPEFQIGNFPDGWIHYRCPYLKLSLAWVGRVSTNIHNQTCRWKTVSVQFHCWRPIITCCQRQSMQLSYNDASFVCTIANLPFRWPAVWPKEYINAELRFPYTISC